MPSHQTQLYSHNGSSGQMPSHFWVALDDYGPRSLGTQVTALYFPVSPHSKGFLVAQSLSFSLSCDIGTQQRALHIPAQPCLRSIAWNKSAFIFVCRAFLGNEVCRPLLMQSTSENYSFQCPLFSLVYSSRCYSSQALGGGVKERVGRGTNTTHSCAALPLFTKRRHETPQSISPASRAPPSYTLSKVSCSLIYLQI